MRMRVCNSPEVFSVRPFRKKTDARETRVVVVRDGKAFVGYMSETGTIRASYNRDQFFHLRNKENKVYAITSVKYTPTKRRGTK